MKVMGTIFTILISLAVIAFIVVAVMAEHNGITLGEQFVNYFALIKSWFTKPVA